MPYDAITPPSAAAEPLARASDVDAFRDALAQFRSGAWAEDRFTAFRLRFGVYGQRQAGVQMVRIKLPGGILPVAWARKMAEVTRRFAKGEAHVTTRQDFQIYYVDLDDAPAMLESLDQVGMTTREACGNTLRNMSSCALAGVCPREHVDAGRVAEQLARSWIRHPLVQHMPRKFKISVSGCATDCGAATIHDLGLVATEKDGKPGFKVYAGGGLGGIPRPATLVSDFVTEYDLPAVLEALVRLHQRYSNRRNRNAARIKFVVKRFGEEKFRELFEEELVRARALPQRPWEPLAWRQPSCAPEPISPGGVVSQHDGRMSIVASLPLGLLSADQLDGLADIAERYAGDGLRTTREQNIAILGVEPEVVQDAISAVRALGIPVQETVGDTPDVVSCPGTTTCRIGITNSQTFGREVGDLVTGYAPKPNVSVRISGCQNACGLHQVGDFGFRGMGKKIAGQNAPHYQIYIGGDAREQGAIGLAGPIVLALHAREALALLLEGYAGGGAEGESVRDWALRLGKPGLAAILAPIEAKRNAEDDRVFVDWGESEIFRPPSITQGECAAGFILDSLYADLANDGLIRLDRSIFANDRAVALSSGAEAVAEAARRLLLRVGADVDDGTAPADILARFRTAVGGEDEVTASLDAVDRATNAANGQGDIEAYREAVALFIDTADEIAAKPLEQGEVNVSALGDFDDSVLALIRGQAAAE